MVFDHLSIFAAGGALILAFTACAASPATAAPDLFTQGSATPTADVAAQEMIREDSQGAITVSVTPLNLDAPGDTLKFDVIMSTHSIELDMNLATLATLETDTGLSVQPAVWDGPRGGHHVQGVLSFPAGVDGKSLLDDVKKLTLTIRDVDAPERVFIWELAP